MKLNDPQKLINEISVVAKDFNKIKKSLIPQKFILHNKTVNLSILYMNIYIYIYKYIYIYIYTTWIDFMNKSSCQNIKFVCIFVWPIGYIYIYIYIYINIYIYNQRRYIRG